MSREVGCDGVVDCVETRFCNACMTLGESVVEELVPLAPPVAPLPPVSPPGPVPPELFVPPPIDGLLPPENAPYA